MGLFRTDKDDGGIDLRTKEKVPCLGNLCVSFESVTAGLFLCL